VALGEKAVTARRATAAATSMAAARSGPTAPLRPAWAEIDLAAIRHNARLLRDLVAPAEVCAVVKAWGYGHGPVQAARAALQGGATSLAVALVEEGRQLRGAGIKAPVLLLSEPARPAMAEVVRSDLTPTVYTEGGVEALTSEVVGEGRPAPFPVHVKIDTGMHRVGAAPDEAVRLALEIAARPELELRGLWTHFAVADELGSSFTRVQLDRFLDVVDRLAGQGVRPPVLHAANSAAALCHPDTRLQMVRCGLAVYGLAPSLQVAEHEPCSALRQALSLRARVSHVKEVEAGERLSYGLRYLVPTRSVVATVPLGYADGVTRSLSATGGQVLIGGRRYPIAGNVTMDQILVDCGPGADVAVGDVVVLLGRQGSEEITAWEWAERTSTIAYEVVCGVSARVPRIYRP
jgi:alanine racemase